MSALEQKIGSRYRCRANWKSLSGDTNQSIFLFSKNPESSCQEKPIGHRSYGIDVGTISKRNSDS